MRFTSAASRKANVVLKNANGQLISDCQGICDIFSGEFSKNFSTEASCNIPTPFVVGNSGVHAGPPVLSTISIDIETVRHVLANQKNSAAGPDGIPAIFYKSLSSCLAVPLTIVYQYSIYEGVILDAWRMARIIPSYKGKGSLNNVSSYRPISLTDIACKMLERVITDRIQDHLLRHDLITDQQHSFVP